jgi:CubicO group peptidase (beta-lactamase class C family)
MRHDLGSKKQSIGRVRAFGSVKACFAHGTSDHHGPQPQEAWPRAPNRPDNSAHGGINAGEQVLIQNEERLNRLNVAVSILDRKVPIIESLSDRVFDKFIEAVVLASFGEGVPPMTAVRQFRTRHHRHAAVVPGASVIAGTTRWLFHRSNLRPTSAGRYPVWSDRAYAAIRCLEGPMRRNPLLIVFGLLIMPRLAAAQASDCDRPSPGSDGWAVASPSEAGLDPKTLCDVVPRFVEWRQADVHGIVVVHHGALAFEHYFSGADAQYGTAIPNATFSADTLHDVRSVTKSVTSLCLGIALDHGWVKSLEAPVISFFPEWTDLRTAEKDGITLRHLLTMSAGLDWNENVPYTDPMNSEIRMDRAPDPYRFAFEQPAMVSPGEVYNYSGGDTNLISAVLRQATGRSIEQLAKDELFDPLGITAVHWYHFSNGDPIAASGLRLRPRDMAKLGQLMLNHGQWGGRQVVSAAYVDAAITPQINGQGLFFYGYQFWLGRSFVNGREIDWAAAVGLGGQRIFIVPALDLVTVVTAGLYNDNLQGSVPLVVLNRYVLPAALKHTAAQ